MEAEITRIFESIAEVNNDITAYTYYRSELIDRPWLTCDELSDLYDIEDRILMLESTRTRLHKELNSYIPLPDSSIPF